MTDGSPGERPPLRIGNAEREAAMKALDEHLAEGRLGPADYGERSAVAATATTADELRALFVDLPAPHPRLPGAEPALPPTAAMPVVGPGGEVQRPRGFLDEWGPRLVAVAPLVALGLFLLTRNWVFFLLIPLAGALFWSNRHRGRE
jgi:uncharacterized protein DUF1707